MKVPERYATPGHDHQRRRPARSLQPAPMAVARAGGLDSGCSADGAFELKSSRGRRHRIEWVPGQLGRMRQGFEPLMARPTALQVGRDRVSVPGVELAVEVRRKSPVVEV
jgi:hypothetical protein